MTNTNDPYKTNGQNSHAGSTNQGSDEARKGPTASPQQPGESYDSYQTRLTAYNGNKS